MPSRQTRRRPEHRHPVGLLAGCNTPGASEDGVLTGPCIDFAPDIAPTSGTVVARKGAGSTCDLLQVEIVITDVTAVSSVAFTANYDPTIATFESISKAGSFLGTSFNTQIFADEPNSGELQVGIARLDLTPVDANGTELVMTLSFDRVATTGAADLTVNAGVVLGSGPVPLPKIGITRATARSQCSSCRTLASLRGACGVTPRRPPSSRMGFARASMDPIRRLRA